MPRRLADLLFVLLIEGVCRLEVLIVNCKWHVKWWSGADVPINGCDQNYGLETDMIELIASGILSRIHMTGGFVCR